MSSETPYRDHLSTVPSGAAKMVFTQAQLTGNNAEALSDIIWKANLHPKFYGYAKTLAVIQSILESVHSREWELTGSKRSDETLAIEIAGALEPMKSAANDATVDGVYREQVFRLVGTNPLRGSGAKQHGLAYILWDDAPEGADDIAQAKWLALKAHLLRAHMRIMAHDSTSGKWVKSEEPRPGFWQALYYVCGRFARHFLRSRVEWLLALSLMPDFVSPKDYTSKIVELRLLVEGRALQDTDKVEQRLRSIRTELLPVLISIDGFLRWGEHPEEHEVIVSPRDLSGATNGFWDEGEDEGGGSRRQHLPTRWRMRPSLRRKLLNIDDDPAEELLSSGRAQAESEAAAARLCGGSVEAANQLLPFSIFEPTANELARLLEHLDDMSSRNKGADVLFAAMISTIIWAGVSPKEVPSLIAYCQPEAAPDVDLALRFNLDFHGQPCLPGVWRIRALLPKYLKELPEISGSGRERVSHFELPDHTGAARFVLEQLRSQVSTVDQPSALSRLSNGSAVSVFPQDANTYRKVLRDQLRGFDPSGRLTATRLSRVVFQRIVETSGGDIASAAIVTRNDHYLASVRRFYATPSIEYLRYVHAQAFECILKELAKCGWAASSLTPPALSKGEKAVGSRLCATIPAMRGAFEWLRNTICRQLPLSNSAARDREFAIKHNAYTLYTVWAFSLSVGMRGIRTPYVHPRLIDPGTRMVTIADKDNGTDYKRRLSIVLEAVYRQMQLYDQYLDSLGVIGLPKGTRDSPCYFLKLRGTKFTPVIVQPATINLLSKEFFPFPANFGRRLIKSELSERRIPPEYIDAWMGHWFRGEEPWGPYSCLSYKEYIACLQTVDSALSALFEAFGFVPVGMEFK